MLGDKDVRVRNCAVSSIINYIKEKSKYSKMETLQISLVEEFVHDRVFQTLPMPLCNFKININSDSVQLQTIFAKVLYRLTNKLLEIHDKNQQVYILYYTYIYMCRLFLGKLNVFYIHVIL